MATRAQCVDTLQNLRVGAHILQDFDHDPLPLQRQVGQPHQQFLWEVDVHRQATCQAIEADLQCGDRNDIEGRAAGIAELRAAAYGRCAVQELVTYDHHGGVVDRLPCHVDFGACETHCEAWTPMVTQESEQPLPLPVQGLDGELVIARTERAAVERNPEVAVGILGDMIDDADAPLIDAVDGDAEEPIR